MLAVNIIYLNKSIMHLSDIGSYFDRLDIIGVAAFVKSHWMSIARSCLLTAFLLDSYRTQ